MKIGMCILSRPAASMREWLHPSWTYLHPNFIMRGTSFELHPSCSSGQGFDACRFSLEAAFSGGCG